MVDAELAFSDQNAYYELACYTLVHPDPSFIHQYMVDAYAAQHANVYSKPISVAVALAGLSLHLERGYSGRQVRAAAYAVGEEETTLAPLPPSHRSRGHDRC